MSNDCLVTKLKGVVDNDSLDIYGYIKFTLAAASAPTKVGLTVWDQSLIGQKAILKGNAYFVNSNGTGNLGKEFTLAEGTNSLYISTGSGYLFIPGKYKEIAGLTINNLFTGDAERVSLDVSSLNYNQRAFSTLLFGAEDISAPNNGVTVGNVSGFAARTGIVSFNKCVGATGDLSDFLENMADIITNANFRNTNIAASTVAFGKCTKVTNFRGSKETYGNFAELGKMLACTRLEPDNGSAKITGTIEGFVAAAIAARQAAGESGAGQIGTSYFDLKFPSVTYSGGSIVTGDAMLSWDAQGNITWA